MIGVGRVGRLGSIPSAIRQIITPSILYSAGEQGVWYDPSDFIRYMSQVTLGPELVTNTTFNNLNNWTNVIGVAQVINGRARVTRPSDNSIGRLSSGALACTPGRTYRISIERYVGTCAGGEVVVSNAASTVVQGTVHTSTYNTDEPLVTYFVATQANHWVFLQTRNGAEIGQFCEYDNVSVRELVSINGCTLYQDAGGITPVTAVEQSVALMIDRSRGGFPGPELYTGGNIVGVAIGGATFNNYPLNITSQPGRAYQIDVDVTGYDGTGTYSIGGVFGTDWVAATVSRSGNGKWRFIVIALRSIAMTLFTRSTNTATFNNISVRELAGNHAYQLTPADRPVLRNRYNILTQTDIFTDWTLVNTTRAVHTDGSAIITKVTGNQSGFIFRTVPTPIPVGGAARASVSVKRGNTDLFGIRVQGQYPNTVDIVLNMVTGSVVFSLADTFTELVIDPVTITSDGFYNLSFSFRVAGSPLTGFLFGPASLTNRGWDVGNLPNNSFVYAKNADLRYQTLAPVASYQSVRTATDYDSDPNKFPLYLACNGSNTSMQTINIDFTMTDKVTVFTGVRKLTDAAVGMIAEFGNYTDNNSTFGIAARTENAGYGFRSRGTVASATSMSGSPFPAPHVAVLTGVGDISGDLAQIYVNGVLAAPTSTTDQGSGNYGNYPLFLFRRGGTSLPFNGNFYGLVIRGALCNNSQTLAIQNWLSQRTR